MRPLRCQPHPLYLPRPGQASVPQSKVAGWTLGARGLGHEYKGPPWPRPAPEKAESACDLIAFYAAYPEATCSFKTALALATLMRAYAIRVTSDAR